MSDDQIDEGTAPEPQPLSPHAPEVELVDVQTTVLLNHIPGTPLETRADRDAREAAALEPKADVQRNAHVTEYLGEVDTTSPEANLATRSNIVPGGPGTVGA